MAAGSGSHRRGDRSVCIVRSGQAWRPGSGRTSMTGQVQSTPAEQVSVDAPARRVRRMARAQVAIIGVVSMLLGIEGLLVPLIPPDERLSAYAVLIGLMSLGGLAL